MQAVFFVIVAAVMRLLAAALRQHEEGFGRERVLRAAGAALVAARDRDGIYVAAFRRRTPARRRRRGDAHQRVGGQRRPDAHRRRLGGALPRAAGTDVDLSTRRPLGMRRDAREQPPRRSQCRGDLTNRDISARNELKDQLRHQAFTDGLTGLANRVLLGDRLAQALARTRRTCEPLGVLFIDLERQEACWRRGGRPGALARCGDAPPGRLRDWHRRILE